MPEKIKKVNGNMLKIVACISMFIDHFAAGAILPIVNGGFYKGNLDFHQLSKLYFTMRCIGRWAFPIYCFLLIEGFVHTKSRIKYALSLLIFGLISELPFDICFYTEYQTCNPNVLEVLTANKSFLLEQCNVYFTLLAGLLVIWAIDASFAFIREKNLPAPLTMVSCALFTLIGSVVTYRINTDYDYRGIVLIVIFYILKKYGLIRLLTGYLFIANMYLEYMAFPGFILMALYNGKRGRKLGFLKYFFYAFYPAHLVLIYVFRCYYAAH